MPVSKSLRRLLRVREIEEEQQKSGLESALVRLRQLAAALHDCAIREHHARTLVRSGDILDRLTAVMEMETAQKRMNVLTSQRSDAEHEAERLRESLLEKRKERRQAETLIESARAQNELDLRKRDQQRLDDWHASRHRDERAPSVCADNSTDRRES